MIFCSKKLTGRYSRLIKLPRFLISTSFGIILKLAFLNCTNPGLYLFIFILFKCKFYRKTVGFSGVRSRIVGIEGKHADHLTTITSHYKLLSLCCLLSFGLFKWHLQVSVKLIWKITFCWLGLGFIPSKATLVGMWVIIFIFEFSKCPSGTSLDWVMYHNKEQFEAT